MKIEAEIKEVYAVVKSSYPTCMGCYYPEDDYCEIYYAQSIGELFTLVSECLISPERGVSFDVYIIKALIYNGDIYSRAVSGDYIKDYSFMDDYKGNFISSQHITGEEYKKLIRDTTTSKQYRDILEEKKRRDELEKQRKLDEAKKKKAERKKKEYELYLKLKKEYNN